jgi:hypothetical protein
VANTEIEATLPGVSQTAFFLWASLPYLFRFSVLLILTHVIKERRVNPPLFKDQDERGRCLVLENSPPLLRDLHVRKEKRKCSFSFPKHTEEENGTYEHYQAGFHKAVRIKFYWSVSE